MGLGVSNGVLGDLSVARVAGRIAANLLLQDASAGFPTELKPVSSNCNAIEVSSPAVGAAEIRAGTCRCTTWIR